MMNKKISINELRSLISESVDAVTFIERSYAAMEMLDELMSRGKQLFGGGEWIDELTETRNIIKSMSQAANMLDKRNYKGAR